MKRSICLSFLPLVCCLQLLQAQIFVPVKDAEALKKNITAAQLKILTITCNFQQVKELSMLSEKAISNGRFYFKKESKVRLEYLTPSKSLIVMNEGKIFTHDGKNSSKTDTHRNKALQQLNNIIVGSINGSLFTGKDFTSKFFETAAQIIVELKPTSKVAQNILSNIVIVFVKKDFTAESIEMNETSGDKTLLTFSAKEINSVVNDSLFSIR